MFPAISSCHVALRAKCRATNFLSSVAAQQWAAAAAVSRNFSVTTTARKTFEPDYLDGSGPGIPTYPPLNIQLKSYNFDLLESYQSYVHKTAENMGIDVEESWATPPKTYKVSNFNKGSMRVKLDFVLNLYERNLQISNLRSVDAPMLIDILRATLPQSVQLSLHPHEEEHYEARFIPDPFIDSIRKELAEGDEKKAVEKEKRMEASAAKAAKKQAALLETLQAEDN